MSDPQPASQTLRSQRAHALSGTYVVPGDPQIAQRALLAAAMAMGESSFGNVPNTVGTATMIRAIQALGAVVEAEDGVHRVNGLGAGGLLSPQAPIDVTGAEGAAGLLLGALGLYPFTTTLRGIAPDPVRAVLDTLAVLGATVLENKAGRPPTITVTGPRVAVPGTFASAAEEATNTLLLSALATPGVTRIRETRPCPDDTDRVLNAFGASISVSETAEARNLALTGLPDLRAQSFFIPGDPAAAAAVMIAALAVADSEVRIENVLMNPWRALLMQSLIEMGADLRVLAHSQTANEDVAAIRARHSRLSGITIPASRTVLMREEMPVLMLAACFAAGDTVIEGFGAETEQDSRFRAVARGLNVNGVAWQIREDSLIIHGQGRVTGGGLIPLHPDPLVPLVFLVMGMATRDPVTIADAGPLTARYPGMVEALEGLGAAFRKGP